MASPAPATRRHHHWRLIVAGVFGVAVVATALYTGAPNGLSALIGWNAACVVFLALTWALFGADEAAVRARAGAEDQGAPIMVSLVLTAVAASLAATILALSESKKTAGHGGFPWPVVLSVSTLILGWLVIQTVFTLRYAHVYFGDNDQDGTINGGVKFEGDPPRDYRSFIYMAVCIGASSQVSDFNILTDDLRELVTTHALVSFAFNVAVLALGINMVASIIGQ